jgi:hypothetical protein
MKKNGKDAEDVRYHGTALGRDSELQSVPILGGPVSSIADWIDQFRARTMSPHSEMEVDADEEGASIATSVLSSAPPTPPAQAEAEAQTPMSQDQPPT